jgi:MFS family permease
MSSSAAYEGPEPRNKHNVAEQFQHVENTKEEVEENLVYEEDEEPELHAQTYFALAAMFLLNLVQVFGLLGPPTVVLWPFNQHSYQLTDWSLFQLSYIEKDLNNTAAGTWVPNSLSLVQAVVAPLIASLSDTFQARKAFLVGPAIISFIGCAIAPESTDIYRLIAAQVLIGFGFATVPLAYCVPSDILPRKWRPSEFSLFRWYA